MPGKFTQKRKAIMIFTMAKRKVVESKGVSYWLSVAQSKIWI